MKKVTLYRNKTSPRESDGVAGCPSSFEDLTFLPILDEETVDHNCYVRNVIPVTLKYGNEVFDGKWIFQQDGRNSHRNHLREE